MNILELMKDKAYVSDLLNGPCIPKNEMRNYVPLDPKWIDEEASAAVTTVFRRLMPDGIPYLTYIIVERNPETLYDGLCVDDNNDRMRYFIVTIIPDTEYPYDYSFPLINQMWLVSLHCWEIIRATLAAATSNMRVLIANDPVPPILNNARLEWVSLYLGRKPYRGLSKLSQQWTEAEVFDACESDVHLYKIREMEPDPILQRLLDAYETDHPEVHHGKA